MLANIYKQYITLSTYTQNEKYIYNEYINSIGGGNEGKGLEGRCRHNI